MSIILEIYYYFVLVQNLIKWLRHVTQEIYLSDMEKLIFPIIIFKMKYYTFYKDYVLGSLFYRKTICRQVLTNRVIYVFVYNDIYYTKQVLQSLHFNVFLVKNIRRADFRFKISNYRKCFSLLSRNNHISTGLLQHLKKTSSQKLVRWVWILWTTLRGQCMLVCSILFV